MKRISLTLCLAFLTVLFCQAQVAPLKFNKNGEFKIVQFTDIHFQYHNPASAIALKRFRYDFGTDILFHGCCLFLFRGSHFTEFLT